MDLSAAAWEARYKNNDTPWDLQSTTPEFARLAKEGFFKKGKAIVPGGGLGHDAILLASQGMEVDLIDFSPTALELALIESAKKKVIVNAFCFNFFELGQRPYHKEAYDYFLEYTFFCAIDPKLRKDYVRTASQILKPGGILVGLFFPLKTEKEGPPFLVSQQEIEEIFSPFFEIKIETPQESVNPRNGRELLVVARKN